MDEAVGSPVCSSWSLLVTVMEGDPLHMMSPQQQCEQSLCEAEMGAGGFCRSLVLLLLEISSVHSAFSALPKSVPV